MSYTKLFNSIISSTIWTEDDQTRIVWITMIAMADKNGEVHGSIPGLARMAGVSLEATDKAIAKFLAPDPYSRTKDEEGRRIEEIDGGWSLINHAKYRHMASKEDAKEKNAERQRRFKAKQVTAGNAPVTPSNDSITQNRDIAEAEAEAEKKIHTHKKECVYPSIEEFTTYLQSRLPEINTEWNHDRVNRAARLQFETFTDNGWKDGNGKIVKNWKTKSLNIMSYKKPWNYGKNESPHKHQPNMQL